ncbi:MAG: ABC transporter substrate-binding protein [Polyangiaceae bacterium]|nr:ABC transporter substrate-binding protein [Polyangiaceae bacterium]
MASGCGSRRPERTGATLWYSYGGRNRETLERLVRRYNAAERRYVVRSVFQGDYYEGLAKLRLALAARAAPGLSHVIAEVIPYLDGAGVLQPLDGREGAADLDVLPELGQRGTWVGGADRRLVALPFNRSTPIAYLDGELFERHRLGAPATWDELRETARILTVRRSGRVERFGFECPISWWFWLTLVIQAGGSLVEDDGTVSLGGDAGVQALEFWQTMVHRDRSMKPPPGRDANANEAVNRDYLSRRAAMIWNSTAFLRYLEDHARFPVTAAALPRGRRRGVPTGGTFFVMLAQAPDREKEAAWSFLRFMLAPEQVIEWSASTGYLPVTRSAIDRLQAQGYYERHPNHRVAYEQLRVASAWPWWPSLLSVQREILEPLIERAVLTGGDARRMLSEARARALIVR